MTIQPNLIALQVGGSNLFLQDLALASGKNKPWSRSSRVIACLEARYLRSPLVLPIDAGRKKVDRPAIAIKAGVCKVLIIEGEICRGVQRPIVIGLDDILGPRVSQLSVSDK